MNKGNLKKYVAFIAVGLPAFLLAVPINYALVEWMEMDERIAYALVLVMQVSINFVMCKAFVFEKSKASNLLLQFVQFLVGILAVRVLDWAFYVFLVKSVGVYFLAAQIFNVFLFSVIKFVFAKFLFERKKLPS